MPAPLPDLNVLMSHIALYDSEHAYKQLFKILFPALYRFSYCLLKSRPAAEEVASDVLINLWKNRHRLIEVREVRVYAFVMARNLSLNVLNRKQGKACVSLDDLSSDIEFNAMNPEQLLINGELRQRLDGATGRLPIKCKLVFKLIKEDGLSYKETADVLKISVKTVDAHLVNAVKKLTAILQAEFKLN